MTRLLFDPNRMKQKESSPVGARTSDVLTVSALAAHIDAAIRSGLPATVRVIGEISGARQRTHWYFDLKDAQTVIGCVMFASAARRARAEVVDGQQVVVTGSVEYYARQGRISLIVDRIEPVGAGALDAAFRRLCDEIRSLGWFADERKRPLPLMPRRVAIVTSKSGAAVHDVLTTMASRCPAVEAAIVDVRVQGDGAAEEIARAIRWLSAHHEALGVDVVIVTRGGGSLEDLWAFNERVVAEAIVQSRVPVVAAIGHESDTTIAELVADVRASTPTQAAVRVTPDRAALLEQVSVAESRLRSALIGRIERAGQRVEVARRALQRPGALVERTASRAVESHRRMLDAMRHRLRDAELRLSRNAARLERHRPAALHAARAATITQLTRRLRGAGMRLPAAHARRLEAMEARLHAVAPLAVLQRGFSVTFDAKGKAVRDADAVRAGQRLTTRVARGSFASIVDKPPERRQRDQPPANSLFDV